MQQKLYTSLVRTIRTFVAAFLAQMIITTNPYTKQALYACVVAGITAVWNLSSAS